MPFRAQAAGGWVSPRLVPGRSRGEASLAVVGWELVGRPGHTEALDARMLVIEMGAVLSERFRVVSEDEFWQGASMDWSAASARPPHEDRWRRRVAGAALVAGAVGAVGAVTAVSLSLPTRHSRRPDAVGAATQPRRHASPVIAHSLLASVELREHAHHAARRARGSDGSKGHPGTGQHAFVSGRLREVRRARRSAQPATSDLQRVAPAREAARPVLAAASSARAPHARQAEFGFER